MREIEAPADDGREPLNAASAAWPEPLWNSKQVADYYQVPESTVVQWRYLGTGPKYRRLGRHVRYDPRDVRAWQGAA